MTPKELNIFIETYSERQRNRFKEDITVAFYNAYFQRVKTLSANELKKVIRQLSAKEMSDEDMFSVVKSLNAQFGGD